MLLYALRLLYLLATLVARRRGPSSEDRDTFEELRSVPRRIFPRNVAAWYSTVNMFALSVRASWVSSSVIGTPALEGAP
jgi:hypothetical protein